jgi:predicted GNAT family acetyltransferase
MKQNWHLLQSGEEPRVHALIASEPEVNLFISGDLANFGLDGKHVRIYYHENGGASAGILLRYNDCNYVFYTQDKAFPFEDIATIIREENPSLKGVCLSGKSELIRPVVPFLAPLKLEETMMARCNRLKKPVPQVIGAEVRYLRHESEFKEAYELIAGIAEFDVSSRGEKATIDSYLAGAKRGAIVVGVYVQNTLVSIASTTADTEESAMLVGVATRLGYRQRGYASLSVSTLLKNRFEKGEKFLCLFYDNPLAGKIYHAFGFEDVAPYAMLH